MMSLDWRHSVLASLGRCYPFYSGCGYLANHRLMKILAPPSSDLAWAKTSSGVVQVPLDDHVGRAVFLFGDLDPKITWVVRRLLKPGDLAIDIGANLGLITLLMSKLVGPKGTVYAFEPNPNLTDVFEATRTRNGAMNVRFYPVALGATPAEMQLRVPQGNLGGASLAQHEGTAAQSHAVSVARLDDILAPDANKRIALIKLDVEGFELEVLRGAENLIRNDQPAAVLFEANDGAGGSKTATVMRFLRDCGYDFITLPQRLVRMGTKRIKGDSESSIGGHDIIAAPRGEGFERIRGALRAA